MKVVCIRNSKVKMFKYEGGKIHSWRECPDCGGTGYPGRLEGSVNAAVEQGR